MLSIIIGFLLNSFLPSPSPPSVSLLTHFLPSFSSSPSLFSLISQGKKLKKELEDLDNDDGEVSDEDEAADIDPQEYKKAGVENPEPAPTVRWISVRTSNCVLTI